MDSSQRNEPEEKVRVKNAADPQQQREAKRTQKDEDRLYFDSLQAMLATPEGRVVLWTLLKHCKTFESVWAPSSLISYNSGRQDVGHYLLDQITRANPDALLQMMKDNSKETVG